MGFMFWFIWVLLSLFIAFLADSRGRIGGAWFCISFITSPIFALIVLLVIKNVKEEETKDRERKEDREFQVKQIEAITKKASADELLKLAELREKGMITNAEFESFKSKLFAQ